MKEADFKKLVRKRLNAEGAFVFTTSDSSRRGVPDLYVCIDGISVWLELKYHKEEDKLKHELTPLQSVFLSDVENAGGIGAVLVGVGDKYHIERITEVARRDSFDYNLIGFDDVLNFIREANANNNRERPVQDTQTEEAAQMMRKKYSHHLFPTNPEYVLPILKDMPQLKEFFNEKYYQAWHKSLNSPKKVYPFDDYEFKIKPYEHQKVAMSFARQLPRCALFMETGTGKTMTSLNVAEMRIKAGIVKKVLVIAPASVLKTGWYADLKKFTNMTGVILHPQKNFSCVCPVCFRRFLKKSTHAKHEHKFPFPEEMEWRKHKTFEERLYNIDADVYITSHQLARINKKHLINKGFDMVILDESTILKNPQVSRLRT